MGGATARPLGLGPPRQTLAEQVHVPAIGLVEASQAVQQRRLAAARRAEQRHHFARSQAHAHAAQGQGLGVTIVEKAIQVDRAQGRHAKLPAMSRH